MSEKDFQNKVVRWLKLKGLFVLVLTVQPGVPKGFPDVLGLIDGGGWVALEIKPHAKARFQVLQKATIKKLDGMFYSKAVYPENWDETKEELSKII